MTTDRYTRAILTVIALALVYLCVVLTPIPTAAAQTAKRPGDPTGPAEVVIVGWRPAKGDTFPVSVVESVPLEIKGDVSVRGTVQTEQRPSTRDRVVLVGWEESAVVTGKPGIYRMLNPDPNSRLVALPVMTIPPR